MKSLKILAGALALSLSLTAVAAGPTTKADNYQLTPAFMNKMKALQNDASLKDMKDNDDEEDAKSKTLKDPVDDIEYKINKVPGANAALAKHGLTVREYSMALVASMHAGFYLMGESIDKKKSQEMLATFTPAQKANVALMRTMMPKK